MLSGRSRFGINTIPVSFYTQRATLLYTSFLAKVWILEIFMLKADEKRYVFKQVLSVFLHKIAKLFAM